MFENIHGYLISLFMVSTLAASQQVVSPQRVEMHQEVEKIETVDEWRQKQVNDMKKFFSYSSEHAHPSPLAASSAPYQYILEVLSQLKLAGAVDMCVYAIRDRRRQAILFFRMKSVGNSTDADSSSPGHHVVLGINLEKSVTFQCQQVAIYAALRKLKNSQNSSSGDDFVWIQNCYLCLPVVHVYRNMPHCAIAP